MRLEIAAVLICCAIAPTSHADDSAKYPLRLKFVETKSSTATTTSAQTQTRCTPVPGTEQVNCNSRQIGGGPHTALTSTVEASDGNTYEVMCVQGAGGRFLAGGSNAVRAQSSLPTSSGCQVQPGTYQARWDKGRLKVLLHNSKGKERELTFAVLSSHVTESQIPAASAQPPPAIVPSISAQQPSSNESDMRIPSRMGTGEALLDQCKKVEHMDDYKVPKEDAAGVGLCLGFIRGMTDCESLRKSIDSMFTQVMCIPQGVSDLQLAKIVVKYGNDHPKELHFPASSIVLNALTDAFPCK
jgi:hypothetical protein